MAKRPVIALACLNGDFASPFESYLDRRGYEVRRATEDWEVRALLAVPLPDVVVLGDMLPAHAASDLLRRFQGAGDPCIILLRPKSDLIETVLALELGPRTSSMHRSTRARLPRASPDCLRAAASRRPTWSSWRTPPSI